MSAAPSDDPRWSPVRQAEVPVTLSLSACEAAVWRRRVGFVEEGSAGGAAPVVQRTGLLMKWLGSAGPGLSLRLVFKVGGRNRSTAWIGLSAVGATPRDARRRLVEPAQALGEALDAWGCFEDIPRSGPRYPRAGRQVISEAAAQGPRRSEADGVG